VNKKINGLAIFFILILILITVQPIFAYPSIPTTFYGNASVNGTIVVTRTNISAYDNSWNFLGSVPANSSATYVYNFQITCIHYETIRFKINNLTVIETGTCDYLENLNLTATDSTPPGINITSPTSDQIFNNKEIEVNGTSSDSGYGLSHTNISIYNSTGSLINSTVETQTLNYTDSWSKDLSVSVDGFNKR